jgi:chromosome segregation ATPase
MSTAGKVLSVLILLSSLVWMILTAGVTQLNRNGNDALKKLTERVDQLQADPKISQKVVATKDAITVLQEHMDMELAMLRARQNDVQRLSSNVAEVLSRVKYELEVVQKIVQDAEIARSERTTEKEVEQKALEAARNEVSALKSKDAELRARLHELREQFAATFTHNTEGVRKIMK